MRSALFSSPSPRSSALALIGLAVLGTGLSATSAQAGGITYTFSGAGSGSVNGTAFNNAPFSFSFTTDTSTVHVDPNIGVPGIAAVTAAVSLTGFGTGVSLNPMVVFDNSNGVAGFYDATTSGDVLDFQAPQFKTYGLTTSLGPIPASFFYSSPFATSLGSISITSVSGGTFAAISAAVPVPAVPEASTTASLGLLLALGMGGLVVAARRKKAGAAL